MFDITALGEILIDFTPSGTNGMGMPLYAQNPGGAPANVLAQSALLGSRTAFIGKVGQDGFGTFLRSVMERSGIDTRALVTSEEVHTTLAFVQLDACGDRSFSFYRNPGADILLRESEVDYDLIRQSHIFHFGSLSLTDEPARSATVALSRCGQDRHAETAPSGGYPEAFRGGAHPAHRRSQLGHRHSGACRPGSRFDPHFPG